MKNSHNHSSVVAVNWPVPRQICAYYTQRAGGFSKGAYSSFNLALHVGDEEQAVHQNRARLRELLNLRNEPNWLDQIHSDRVIDIGCMNVQADASYTRRKEKVCVVMTADCLPILICNQVGTEIAAVHAGWRGLLNGIIENTLNKFTGDPNSLIVFLGPAIGPNRFEVGEEVKHEFLKVDKDAELGFIAKNNGKFLANLYQLARNRLIKIGVNKIYSEDFCTFDQEERFFSYRRDGKTGRMASLIWIAG